MSPRSRPAEASLPDSGDGANSAERIPLLRAEIAETAKLRPTVGKELECRRTQLTTRSTSPAGISALLKVWRHTPSSSLTLVRSVAQDPEQADQAASAACPSPSPQVSPDHPATITTSQSDASRQSEASIS